MKYIFLLCCCTVLFFGCQQNPSNPSAPWTVLTITSEAQTEIIIYNDDDTATVKIYDSGAFSFFAQPKKHKIDTLKVIFNSDERTKIFRLARDIIITPPKLTHHCSDFVGDLDIKIYYGETCTQSIKYSGICNWNVLSDETQALHDILKSKMKKVFLGEDYSGRSHVEN